MHRMSLATLLILAACGPKKAPARRPRPPPPSRSCAPPSGTRSAPGSDPEKTTLRFREDGIFDFLYPQDVAFSEGDNETWVVEGERLTVSWNGGFATTTYFLDRYDGRVIPGESSKRCGAEIRLERADGP